MRRRRLAVVATVGAVSAAAAGAAVWAAGDTVRPAEEGAERTGAEPSTAPVTHRDLARTDDLDGRVGHGEPSPLVLAGDGTLTELPAPGDVLAPGDVAARVDGRPVVVLPGRWPQWRELGPGVSDGDDVLALEYALASLGYASPNDVTVDDEWTSATTRAVKDFQDDHGLADDGVLQLGEVVFVDGTVRVADVEASPGRAVAEAGITITRPEQTVGVDLAVGDADLLAVGDAVDVELPTGEFRRGVVSSIGAAETAESGTTTLPVTVTVDGLGTGADELSDGTPVEVHVEVVAATGVLTVPVEAVLATVEGGYAVEVVEPVDGAAATDPGATRLVPVSLGVFADGLVEITPARGARLAAGAEVVVP